MSKSRSTRSRILLFTLTCLSLLLAFALTAVFTGEQQQPSGGASGRHIKSEPEQSPQRYRDKGEYMDEPLSDRAHPRKRLSKQPLSILVVGIDERLKDSGRTDTIMVFTVNPRDRSIKMLNIPRDTKTVLADVSGDAYDKINHAYSRGNGISSTKKTVEQFLGIPVNYTVSVNMKGFTQIVDLFGGVDVHVKDSFASHGYHYKRGSMQLNGKAALYYVRERTNSSDFDRHRRQQQVVRSLVARASKWSTLANITEILTVFGQNVKTDLTPWQIFQLHRLYGQVGNDNIESLQLSGRDEWSDAYYFVADETSKKNIVETLHAHLQLQ
ncbi:LCP family protein [Numidum massiliense]|uniref:LCP family protein n=1 Tax=Numidum massiliense TaxID=1522315 RepID=UPI0009EA943D|nr:LCP family protein [Numidum massiliense]